MEARHDKKARRLWLKRKGAYCRLYRNGCVYYAAGDYELLNPEVSEGTGLDFVKPNDCIEATGVYKTLEPLPTATEEAQSGEPGRAQGARLWW